MALSRVDSEIFNVETYRDKVKVDEIPVNGQSRSLNVIPFDRLHFYCSVVTLSL